MRHEKGFAVVMSDRTDPQEPNGRTFFFGPTVSEGVSYISEILTTNGFKLFPNKGEAERASTERKEVFGKEFCTFQTVGVDLRIAENDTEWEELRNYGSYVVAAGESLSESWGCNLYGTTRVNGKRVHSAHDSWSPFYANGAHPYTSFSHLVGDRSLGTLSEIVRQHQCRVWLIGIKINWN